MLKLLPPEPTCPACEAQDYVHVIYGLVMPSEELNQEIKEGSARLGGCLVGARSFEFECKACGRGWNEPEDPDDYEPVSGWEEPE